MKFKYISYSSTPLLYLRTDNFILQFLFTVVSPYSKKKGFKRDLPKKSININLLEKKLYTTFDTKMRF